MELGGRNAHRSVRCWKNCIYELHFINTRVLVRARLHNIINRLCEKTHSTSAELVGMQNKRSNSGFRSANSAHKLTIRDDSAVASKIDEFITAMYSFYVAGQARRVQKMAHAQQLAGNGHRVMCTF